MLQWRASSLGFRSARWFSSGDISHNRIAHSNLYRYINAYRQSGHLRAKLDPLALQAQRDVPQLNPSLYGLENSEEAFPVAGLLTLPGAPATATLAQIQQHLEATYCGTMAVEASHLLEEEEREWLTAAVEAVRTPNALSPAEKRNIHSLLVSSEVFDHFMTVKYGSFKRYSLEGAEAMLPCLEAVFVRASGQGVENVVIGMPHRGRFNLLVGLLDYPARGFFAKVGKGISHIPAGMYGKDDVSHHIGQSVRKKFDKRTELNVSLIHNPSHLEAVNPVSQGKVRAKQDYSHDEKRDKSLCVQLHGDAAFAGQGVVYESLMLSRLPSFNVGGTVHIIVNNQVGFTTEAVDGRSSLYASDVVKSINMPVIHVNAEDPESCVLACRIATDFRAKFKRDILVDLIGYRKWGHNEVDEPGFTQPLMYKNIRARPSVVRQYTDKLVADGLLTEASHTKLVERFKEHLEKEFKASDTWQPTKDIHFQGNWKGYGQTVDTSDVPATGVNTALLREIAVASVAYPSSMEVHSRVVRSHIEARLSSLPASEGKDSTAAAHKAVSFAKPSSSSSSSSSSPSSTSASASASSSSSAGGALDWATAEALAFGSLLHEGFHVRLTGQDSERGTFSQRHVVLVDQKTGHKHNTLATQHHPALFKGRFQVVNSNLSELAVMAFEYGYNLESPLTLNLWEAQFGDFFNQAQVTIDTFLYASETKWLRPTGLVLLLPHGFDGAGPEHSTSRMERFLQVCDGDADSGKEPAGGVNLLVANPTTPSNYFHLLRRQMKRAYRKPLVVVAPKTLLRHPACVSPLVDLGPEKRFQAVISDSSVDPAGVTTVAFCSGKYYYDLESARKQKGRKDIALVRLEELSPFPFKRVMEELTKFKNVTSVVYVQEEPANAGAWAYVRPRLNLSISESGINADHVMYVGRPAIPLPAVGSGVEHKRESEQILKDFLAL